MTTHFYTRGACSLRTWTGYLKQELPAGLHDLFARIAERPAVKDALEAEGFIAPAK